MEKFMTGQQLIDDGYRPSEILNAVFQGRLRAYTSHHLQPVIPDPVTQHVHSIIDIGKKAINRIINHKSFDQKEINQYFKTLKQAEKDKNFDLIDKCEAAITQLQENIDNPYNDRIALIKEFISKLESIIENNKNQNWEYLQRLYVEYRDKIVVFDQEIQAFNCYHPHEYPAILNDLMDYSFDVSEVEAVVVDRNCDEQEEIIDKGNIIEGIYGLVHFCNSLTGRCTQSTYYRWVKKGLPEHKRENNSSYGFEKEMTEWIEMNILKTKK